MARFARLVVPGYPHHITQRGVRSIDIFRHDEDRQAYLCFMSEESRRFGVRFHAWCLMTNHVHLIAVPGEKDSLARAIGEAHRRYTRMQNFAAGVRGYLFQGRFNSCVLDERHLLAAARYVELNPLHAGMVGDAKDYPWSSARFHLRLTDSDPLVSERFLPALVNDWSRFLHVEDEDATTKLRQGTRTGRPAGNTEFVTMLEDITDRRLRPREPGRPRKKKK
jgi:putative transposase